MKQFKDNLQEHVLHSRMERETLDCCMYLITAVQTTYIKNEDKIFFHVHESDSKTNTTKASNKYCVHLKLYTALLCATMF